MSQSLIQGWVTQQDNLLNYEVEQEPNDLIQGILPAGAIIQLTGEPKSGKSLIVQSWVHAITTGSEWFGHKAQKGIAFYCYPDGESPRKLLARFKAIEQATGIDLDYRAALPFAREFDIQNELQKENILNALDYEGVTLIVIDTLAASAGMLNLSSQTDIFHFSEFAKKVIDRSNGRTSILFIMHSPKTNPKEISGSTQIKAFGTKIFAMTKRKDSGFGEQFKITCTEDRNGASGWSESFGSEEIDLGHLGSSVVLVKSGVAQNSKSKLSREAELLFGDLGSDEYFPASSLISDLQAKGIAGSRASAYRWLETALKAELIEKDPTQSKQTFYRLKSQSHEFSQIENEPKLVSSLAGSYIPQSETEAGIEDEDLF